MPPMQPHPWTSWLLPLLALAASPPEADPLYYCHNELTWPDIPQRHDAGDGVDLAKVVVFTRHGSRTLANSDSCWVGDDVAYKCHTHTLSGYESCDAGNCHAGFVSPRFRRIGGKYSLKGNCLIGQLVSSGVEMHTSNGAVLSKAYKEALALGKCPADTVRLRADDSARTIESAQALAVGLFPDIEGGSAPIDMIVPDGSTDPMVANAELCPRLTSARKDFFASPEAQQRLRDSRSAREEIGRITGHEHKWMSEDADLVQMLYGSMMDCLYSHVCSTVPAEPRNLPNGLEVGGELWNHIMQENIYWMQGQYNSTKALEMLGTGPLIGEVLHHLLNDDRRFFLYSGHDTGPIGPMVTLMGLRWLDTHASAAAVWPPFAAMLVLEVYSDGSTRWVYNGRVASADGVPGCEGKPVCAPGILRQHLDALVPTDDQCGLAETSAVEVYRQLLV